MAKRYEKGSGPLIERYRKVKAQYEEHKLTDHPEYRKICAYIKEHENDSPVPTDIEWAGEVVNQYRLGRHRRKAPGASTERTRPSQTQLRFLR